MGTIQEIKKLEEQLVQAELVPDAKFFESILSDDIILDGQKAKAKVVAAHQPTGTAKFNKVEMSEMEIIDHGPAAVVTCVGSYTGPLWTGRIRFMRVWVKREQRWQVIAGTTQIL